MSDLRTRILHALIDSTPREYLAPPNDLSRIVDAVIHELGQRRCERCRHYTPVDQFPLPYEGSDRMRPFCNTCTDYIEWATS